MIVISWATIASGAATVLVVLGFVAMVVGICFGLGEKASRVAAFVALASGGSFFGAVLLQHAVKPEPVDLANLNIPTAMVLPIVGMLLASMAAAGMWLVGVYEASQERALGPIRRLDIAGSADVQVNPAAFDAVAGASVIQFGGRAAPAVCFRRFAGAAAA